MNRHCYHWVIALCSLFVLICTHCFPANIFASYLPFIKELGYSGAQASLLVTIRCIASFIGMTLVPLFYRRLNLRWGLSVSCLLMAVAFLIHSFAHNYATYVLGAAIMGLSYGLGGMIPVSLLMNNWFVQRRATALSISSMGIGLGSFIFPPIIVRIAQGISLDAAFRMVSLTSLVVMLLCFLIIRDTPFE